MSPVPPYYGRPLGRSRPYLVLLRVVLLGRQRTDSVLQAKCTLYLAPQRALLSLPWTADPGYYCGVS